MIFVLIFSNLLILSSIEANQYEIKKFNDTRIDLIQIKNDKNIIDAVLKELNFVEPAFSETKQKKARRMLKTTKKRKIIVRTSTTTTTISTISTTRTSTTSLTLTFKSSTSTIKTTNTKKATILRTKSTKRIHRRTRKHKQTTTKYVESTIQTEGFFDRLKKVFKNDD